MSSLRTYRFLAALIVAALFRVATARVVLIASDDAEGYGGWGYGTSGGTGLGDPTYLEGTGGGVYLSTGPEHIDGSKSFGEYAGDGGQAYSRSITTPVAQGEYSLSARFN